MPELWSSLLQSSKITKQEQKENPQAVIDALDFYQHAQHKRESKFMYSSCKSKSSLWRYPREISSCLCIDLTPPISGDLADKFRQTVILVSDQATSVLRQRNLF